MKPKVAIGYLHPGDVSATFAISLLKMELHEAFRTGVPPLILAERCASGRIVDGRNEVTTAFLDRTPCEWLLFVDSDMGFAPDTLERLLGSASTDRPIVGGLCFGLRRVGTDPDHHGEKFRQFPTIYQWVERDDEVGFQIVTDYPRDEIVQVGATGAALVLIHREVMEKVRDQFGDHWFDQVTHPKGNNGKGTKFSEDMSFFIRAQACGFPIYVDTSVKTCHDKGGVFLTEDTWDEQQALVG